MVNHLYWCASSTPDGNPDMMLAKWLSLDNHVVNIHTGHGALFPQCEHAAMCENGRENKWLEPSKFFFKLCVVYSRHGRCYEYSLYFFVVI